MCISSVWYVIPLLLLGANMSTWAFFTTKSKKQPALACPFDNIRVSACPMVAFSGFYESHKPSPSGDACVIVPPHRYGYGHHNGLQRGYMLYCCFACCSPGGRRGDTERVVTQWQRPVASGVALDMLHRVMPHVSHQRLTMAINMVRREGEFVCRRLFRLA